MVVKFSYRMKIFVFVIKDCTRQKCRLKGISHVYESYPTAVVRSTDFPGTPAVITDVMLHDSIHISLLGAFRFVQQ
jgi:hypothetical protein